MAVQGYNFDPESTDTVIDVGSEDGSLAWMSICSFDDFARTINLTYDELRALRGRISDLISKMEWQQATYVYASGRAVGGKVHLQRKGEDAYGKTLCGQNPPEWVSPTAWEQEPVIGKLGSINLCKKCLAKWQRQQAEEASAK